jgi:phage baseplate assembly protein W
VRLRDELFDLTRRDARARRRNMPKVTFGSAIQRHVPVPPQNVTATRVRDALESAFRAEPRLRSYVLDDQSHLRKHMSVFIDGRAIADRKGLSDVTEPDSHIYVVQALSGG